MPDSWEMASIYARFLLYLRGVAAWLRLGKIQALATTAYGLTVLAKIGEVPSIPGAAAANKLRFVPAFGCGDRTAAIRLRRSKAVDWDAVCFILFMTAARTTVPDLPSGEIS